MEIVYKNLKKKIKVKNYEEALEDINYYLTISYENELLFYKAFILGEKKEFDESIKIYENIIEREKNNIKYYKGLIKILDSYNYINEKHIEYYKKLNQNEINLERRILNIKKILNFYKNDLNLYFKELKTIIKQINTNYQDLTLDTPYDIVLNTPDNKDFSQNYKSKSHNQPIDKDSNQNIPYNKDSSQNALDDEDLGKNTSNDIELAIPSDKYICYNPPRVQDSSQNTSNGTTLNTPNDKDTGQNILNNNVITASNCRNFLVTSENDKSQNITNYNELLSTFPLYLVQKYPEYSFLEQFNFLLNKERNNDNENIMQCKTISNFNEIKQIRNLIYSRESYRYIVKIDIFIDILYNMGKFYIQKQEKHIYTTVLKLIYLYKTIRKPKMNLLFNKLEEIYKNIRVKNFETYEMIYKIKEVEAIDFFKTNYHKIQCFFIDMNLLDGYIIHNEYKYNQNDFLYDQNIFSTLLNGFLNKSIIHTITCSKRLFQYYYTWDLFNNGKILKCYLESKRTHACNILDSIDVFLFCQLFLNRTKFEFNELLYKIVNNINNVNKIINKEIEDVAFVDGFNLHNYWEKCSKFKKISIYSGFQDSKKECPGYNNETINASSANELKGKYLDDIEKMIVSSGTHDSKEGGPGDSNKMINVSSLYESKEKCPDDKNKMMNGPNSHDSKNDSQNVTKIFRNSNSNINVSETVASTEEPAEIDNEIPLLHNQLNFLKFEYINHSNFETEVKNNISETIENNDMPEYLHICKLLHKFFGYLNEINTEKNSKGDEFAAEICCFNNRNDILSKIFLIFTLLFDKIACKGIFEEFRSLQFKDKHIIINLLSEKSEDVVTTSEFRYEFVRKELLGDLYWKENNFKEAIKMYIDAFEFRRKIVPNCLLSDLIPPSLLLKTIKSFEKLNLIEKAIEFLEKYATDNYELCIYSAEFFFKYKLYDKAQKMYIKILKEKETFKNLYFCAKSYIYMKNIELGIIYLKKCKKYSTQILIEIAKIYNDNNNYDEAILIIKNFQKLNENSKPNNKVSIELSNYELLKSFVGKLRHGHDTMENIQELLKHKFEVLNVEIQFIKFYVNCLTQIYLQKKIFYDFNLSWNDKITTEMKNLYLIYQIENKNDVNINMFMNDNNISLLILGYLYAIRKNDNKLQNLIDNNIKMSNIDNYQHCLLLFQKNNLSSEFLIGRFLEYYNPICLNILIYLTIKCIKDKVYISEKQRIIEIFSFYKENKLINKIIALMNLMEGNDNKDILNCNYEKFNSFLNENALVYEIYKNANEKNIQKFKQNSEILQSRTNDKFLEYIKYLEEHIDIIESTK